MGEILSDTVGQLFRDLFSEFPYSFTKLAMRYFKINNVIMQNEKQLKSTS